MISRNYQKLVWQYIVKEDIIKYIENLKSRIYKAFFNRYFPKVYQYQFSFIKSPLVITWAIKKNLDSTDCVFSAFEIGYLIFSLSNDVPLDWSLFDFYEQQSLVKKNFLIKYYIKRIKYLVIYWSLDPYHNYLFNLNNLFDTKYYSLKSINFIMEKKIDYKYILSFDVKPYISYMCLSVLLDKLYLDQRIKIYLLKFLDLGILSSVIFYSNVLYNSSIFFKNIQSISSKLLEIFILQLCYEISIMLINYSNCKSIMNKIIFINDEFNILILSQDSHQLKIIKNYLFSFLLFNGLIIKYNQRLLPISLFHNIHSNLFVVATNYQAYPFHFVLKPSLFAQFLLIQQISLILKQSVSKPLFLLVIRLNMLLLSWSKNYLNEPIKKILYIIDYLLFLKICLFIKKRDLDLYIFNVMLGEWKNSFNSLNSFLRYKNKFTVINVNNLDYFNYYTIVKLFWLYRLKCNKNLRKAI